MFQMLPMKTVQQQPVRWLTKRSAPLSSSNEMKVCQKRLRICPPIRTFHYQEYPWKCVLTHYIIELET